jgi:hypothetical protein
MQFNAEKDGEQSMIKLLMSSIILNQESGILLLILSLLQSRLLYKGARN